LLQFKATVTVKNCHPVLLDVAVHALLLYMISCKIFTVIGLAAKVVSHMVRNKWFRKFLPWKL